MKTRSSHRLHTRHHIHPAASARDVGLCLLFLAGCGLALWLVLLLLMDGGGFSGQTSASVQQNVRTGEYYQLPPEEPLPVPQFVSVVLLIGIVILATRWLFISICDRLDRAGHWERVISSRGHTHKH
jgi:hypothetical protein